MSESVWLPDPPPAERVRAAASGEPVSTPAEESPPEEYWEAARRPFASLVFLVPLVLLYEIGVWLVSRDSTGSVRNGVDHWLRGCLSGAGAGLVWAPPLLVLGALLIWQFAGRHGWELRAPTLLGMFAESLVFAFALIVLGTMQSGLLASLDVETRLSLGEAAARSVSYVGAGIYEELVFRLLLLPICYGLFRKGGASPKWSVGLAILATSSAFSIAHYVSGVEPFALSTFAFRTFAGVYFAVLFVTRGFGVTVGCHALYDVVVGVLLAR